MSRNLDPTLASALDNGTIQPAFLAMLTLKSGVEYVWSGVGDMVFNGQTYKGVGDLGSIGPITEGISVQADGTTVTLSGIGLSQIDLPVVIPPTIPGYTPPLGSFLAIAAPTPIVSSAGTGMATVSPGTSIGDPPAAGLRVKGTVPAPPVTAADRGSAIATWTGAGALLPYGAIVESMQVVAAISSGITACDQSAFVDGISSIPSNPNGTYYGSLSFDPSNPQAALAGFSAEIGIAYSLDGEVFDDTMSGTMLIAVYYTMPSGYIPPTTTSLVYEALNDIRVGGPAKIWFGLMANGAFLGAPYLVFSGTVDKPTVNIGPKTSSIILALENRLVNLQRPTMRRYTAADQHLAYPTDSAFNWVEELNDSAWRWGS
jgi:hypothetical protein